jgi:hypothetical protein
MGIHVISNKAFSLAIEAELLYKYGNSTFTSNLPDNSGSYPSSLVVAETFQLHEAGYLTMPPRLMSPLSYKASAKLWKKCYSTAPRVSLAFDLHEPANPSSNAPGAIIFMHGLFGSKKNNRSISK